MLHNATAVHSIRIHDLDRRSGKFIVVYKASVIGESLVHNGVVNFWVLGEGGYGGVSTLSNGRIVLDVIDPDVVVKCLGDVLLNIKLVGKGIKDSFLLFWSGWPRRTSWDGRS